MPKVDVNLEIKTRKTGRGFDAMIRHAESNLKSVCQNWANNTVRFSRALAPVDTGRLKKSIKASKVRDGAWQVEVGAPYGIYVEYGTRYMSAQPYLRPGIRQANRVFKQEFKGLFRGR